MQGHLGSPSTPHLAVPGFQGSSLPKGSPVPGPWHSFPLHSVLLSLCAHSPSSGRALDAPCAVLVVTSVGVVWSQAHSIPPAEKSPLAEVCTDQCRVMPQSLKANSVPGSVTYITLINPQEPFSPPILPPSPNRAIKPNESPVLPPSQHNVTSSHHSCCHPWAKAPSPSGGRQGPLLQPHALLAQSLGLRICRDDLPVPLPAQLLPLSLLTPLQQGPSLCCPNMPGILPPQELPTCFPKSNPSAWPAPRLQVCSNVTCHSF